LDSNLNLEANSRILKILAGINRILKGVFTALVREAKFKIYPGKKMHASGHREAISKFIKINSRYWTKVEEKHSEKEIWVEGHLSEYGPNYLIRTAVIAKALQSISKNNIRVIFNGYAHQWLFSPALYGSFGINKFLFIDSVLIFRNIFFEIKAKQLAKKCWSSLKSGKDLLAISHDEILFGDLIYDDIIKNVPGTYTITDIKSQYFKYVEKAFYYYLKYDALFRKGNVSDFVVTHTAYSEFGLMARVALKYNASVYETTDMHLARFVPGSKTLPTYHEGFKQILTRNWESFSKNQAADEMIDYYQKHLQERLDGKIDQVDVLLAFKNKKCYSLPELREALSIQNNKPLVFIMCHAFADSPHLSSWQMHNDYYDWLLQTLNIIKELDNVNWIIKPHPSVALYKEEGEVGKIVREYSNKNIFLTPDNFNTKSLKECAHAIITVQGTVGVEFTCYGIPTVITGRAFYAGFGFTEEPGTHDKYAKLLQHIEDLQKLDNEQVHSAKKAYAIFNMQLLVENEIIKVEVLNNVWGYINGRDLNKAYDIINANLEKHHPMELPVYKRTLELATV
jgi:hypothetical protein